MKNVDIPPHISLIVGVILMIFGWAVFKGVIPQFLGLLGFILAIIGLAGLIGKIFRKTKKEVL